MLPAASLVWKQKGGEEKQGDETSPGGRSALDPSSNTWKGLGWECSGVRGVQEGPTLDLPALAPQSFLWSCLGTLKGPKTISTPGHCPAELKSQGVIPGSQRLSRHLEGCMPSLCLDTFPILPSPIARLLDIPVSSKDISPEWSPQAPGPSLIFCL